MNILVVEDDDIQADLLCEELERAFNRPPRLITTESEFRMRLAEIASTPPDVAVIDVMLRWTFPSPDMPPRPKDAQNIHRAGLRCKELLAQNENTKDVPVILYTVFDEKDLEGDLSEPVLGQAPFLHRLRYLRKDSDVEPLVRLIREVLAQTGC